ncbi:DUF397 domain-containing protein [Streptomyces sp. NPDC048496]|uniref:DUF397 domain-containing protein n=1 Tax=Streptomyces sp. NPDC048496 TaxID=3365558 RepID=UPI003722BC63
MVFAVTDDPQREVQGGRGRLVRGLDAADAPPGDPVEPPSACGVVCVEVADGFAVVVPVRDSKTAPHGPVVVIGGGAWTAFIAFVRDRW